VKNMFAFAIVFGAIWVIGVFVSWCDVTDSWKNVSRRVGAFLPPYSKIANRAPAPPIDTHPLAGAFRLGVMHSWPDGALTAKTLHTLPQLISDLAGAFSLRQD
jgi:hypothetical protein